MKKLLIALPLVALFGCASQQQPEKKAELATVPDFDVHMMRSEEHTSELQSH